MHITDTLHLIELVAYHAWPAKNEKQYGMWPLRSHFGTTKRANSVLTIGDMPKHPGWLKEIEIFYEKQGIVPCFYISELSPKELDRHLDINHYVKTGDTHMMVIDSRQLIQTQHLKDELTARVELNVTTEWIQLFLQLEEFEASLLNDYETIFQHIKLPKAFFTIYYSNEPVAVGTVVIGNRWGYVANIVVHPNHRRKGIAQHLLYEIAKWASNNDGDHLFLQVVQVNYPALSLYKQLGFRAIASSHYRVKKQS